MKKTNIRKTLKIEVNQETINMLQRLNYEVNARRETICYLLDQHKADKNDTLLTSKVFETYQSQLSDLSAEYELAKDEMIRTYVDPAIIPNIIKWNLDFNTGVLEIEYMNV